MRCISVNKGLLLFALHCHSDETQTTKIFQHQLHVQHIHMIIMQVIENSLDLCIDWYLSSLLLCVCVHLSRVEENTRVVE